jgi:hypothetical protein
MQQDTDDSKDPCFVGNVTGPIGHDIMVAEQGQ